MGFKSYYKVERGEAFTLLNVLTATRAAGGIILGLAMAFHKLSPVFAFIAAAVLAATDAEGFTVKLTKGYPKLQRRLRIIPSTLGRIIDPAADKIFAVSVLAGGIAGGSIPLLHGFGILATEAATAIVTGLASLRGNDPQVSMAGTIGMIARCAVIGFDLAAYALQPSKLRVVIAFVGHISAALAIILGILSCYTLYKKSLKSH